MGNVVPSIGTGVSSEQILPSIGKDIVKMFLIIEVGQYRVRTSIALMSIYRTNCALAMSMVWNKTCCSCVSVYNDSNIFCMLRHTSNLVKFR